jgi:hypothetical protein
MVGGSSTVRKFYRTGGVGGGRGVQSSNESVCLNHSPIPVGRRGVISSFNSNYFYLPSLRHPVGYNNFVEKFKSKDPWMDAK